MFEGITKGLSEAFKKLKKLSAGKLTADNMREGLREVRRCCSKRT